MRRGTERFHLRLLLSTVSKHKLLLTFPALSVDSLALSVPHAPIKDVILMPPTTDQISLEAFEEDAWKLINDLDDGQSHLGAR